MKSGCNLMRKGMKLLAAIVAASVVSTMSISAFGLSYETSTNYSDGTVTVTTNVTLAEQEKDDEIAYLVYETNEANSNTIKYIDQENANGREAMSFTWTTTEADINATAYVGTTDTASSAANNEGKTNVVKVAGYDVTYTVSGNGIVLLAEDVVEGEELGDVAESASLTNVASAVFYVFPEVGYVYKNVTGVDNATSFDEGKAVKIEFAGNANITFNFEKAAGDVALTAESSPAEKAADGVAYKFAKVTGPVKQAGILVAAAGDADAVAALNAKNISSLADAKAKNVYALKAYQLGSTGIYAVNVTDAQIVEGSVVSAYAINDSDELIIVE